MTESWTWEWWIHEKRKRWPVTCETIVKSRKAWMRLTNQEVDSRDNIKHVMPHRMKHTAYSRPVGLCTELSSFVTSHAIQAFITDYACINSWCVCMCLMTTGNIIQNRWMISINKDAQPNLSIRKWSRPTLGWPKKLAPFLCALTLRNVNRFSKLSHYQNQEKICNNTIIKDPTKQVCH